MEYTDREKKAMADVDKLSFLLDDVYSTGLVDDEERDEYVKSIQMVLDLLEKKNKIITEVERYARGIKDEELLLILKKDEIEKLVNECEELLGDE